MNPSKVNLYGKFGIIAPLVGFLVILAAVLSAPWFNWWTNALSDLGVEGLSATIFNNGLKLTAFLMVIFSLGIKEIADDDKIGLAGFVLFLLGSMALLGIGVFPEGTSLHYPFSVAFFVIMPISIWVIGYFMIKGGLGNLGKISIVLGVAAAIIWIPGWDGVAIPEAISALAYAIWAQMLGSLMMKVPAEQQTL